MLKIPVRIILKFFFLFVFISVSFAQRDAEKNKADSLIEFRYWIYFKDKGQFKPSDKITEGSEGWKLAMSELTDKAIWRRSKVLPASELVSYNDIPVYQNYIDDIKKIGLNPHAVSRWFNAVSVKMTRTKIDEVKKISCVDKIEGVHFLEKTFVEKFISRNNLQGITISKNKYDYGKSYWQNEQIKVPLLHNIGVTGYGVRVGMCDDGFNWRHHEALKTRRVLGEFDWIFKDDTVHNQIEPNQVPSDGWDQDGHGTATMSTLGGFRNGKLIGPGFDAEFYLSKTEDGRSETPVEEDFWLSAVEWMESKGVEVISSSLIYKPFDKPNLSYDYSDMNGNATVIVRAADICVHLGVVVCNSMGNEMQRNPPSIVSPPDGDSVIAVGAVDSTGMIAYFSSNGPTSDGRIKPDVVAMGVDVWTAVSRSGSGNDSAYSPSGGTSFSCPLTAGVCSLILSVHPELTPMQVLEALKMTADRKDKPDNVYGWGLINSYEAALYHGIIMSNRPEIVRGGDNNTSVFVYVVSKDKVDADNVKMFYRKSGSNDFAEVKMELREKMNETNSGKYSVTVPVDLMSEGVQMYFSATDGKTNKSIPYSAPGKFFYFNSETNQIEIF